MSSIIDNIECPNCGTEAHSDFYYKTGEEYVSCNNCGYYSSVTFRRDENGDFVTEDGTDNYDFDNLIMEERELKNPYGAYRISQYDSLGYQCGSLESEEQLISLKEQVEKIDNIEYFSVSRFIDGQIVVKHIIDNGPKYDGAGFSEENRLPF